MSVRIHTAEAKDLRAEYASPERLNDLLHPDEPYTEHGLVILDPGNGEAMVLLGSRQDLYRFRRVIGDALNPPARS